MTLLSPAQAPHQGEPEGGLSPQISPADESLPC